MECFEIEIPNTPIWVYFIGDLHRGEILFSQRKFNRLCVDHLSKKNARIVGMGDWISSIPPKDGRFDVRGVDPLCPTIEDARAQTLTFLRAYRKKILWFHTGNHEEHISCEHGDFVKKLCEEAGVKYGGWISFVTINGTTHVISTHGVRSIQSRKPNMRDRVAAMDKQLVDTLEQLGDADLYAMGHSHRILTPAPIPELRLRQVGDDVEQEYTEDNRWFINTGSFLRTYVKGHTNYAEKYGLEPLEIGCVRVLFVKGQIITTEKVIL